jgi:hypothetical protein
VILEKKLRDVGNYSLLNHHGRLYVLMIELKAPAPNLGDMESAFGALVQLSFALGEDLRRPNAHAICFSMVVVGKPIDDGDARLQPIVRCLSEKFQAVVQFRIEGPTSHDFSFAVHTGASPSINALPDRVEQALGLNYQEVEEAIKALTTT